MFSSKEEAPKNKNEFQDLIKDLIRKGPPLRSHVVEVTVKEVVCSERMTGRKTFVVTWC